MECKTREDPTLHLHFQKLFFPWHIQCSAGFLHSYLASFQTELTNINSHFAFTYQCHANERALLYN